MVVRSADGASWDGDGSVPDRLPVLSGCVPQARLALTLDADGNLARFNPHDPTTLADRRRLTCIDRGDCGGRTAGPSVSMALDHLGTLWVMDCAGGLWTVAPDNATCTRTTFVAPPGLERMQLTFAFDPATRDEGLFITSASPGISAGLSVVRGSLARLALDTFQSSPRGLLMGWPSLVGTDIGELWAIFPLNTTLGSASRLSRLDAHDGTELASTPTTPWAWGLDSETAPPCLYAGEAFWCFGHDNANPGPSVLVQLSRSGLMLNQPASPAARLDRRIVAATASLCSLDM